jgi:hypothetical protein
MKATEWKLKLQSLQKDLNSGSLDKLLKDAARLMQLKHPENSSATYAA